MEDFYLDLRFHKLSTNIFLSQDLAAKNEVVRKSVLLESWFPHCGKKNPVSQILGKFLSIIMMQLKNVA